MKMYHAASTYEAALARIRWMFDEFPNVIVSVSGGMNVRWLKQASTTSAAPPASGSRASPAAPSMSRFPPLSAP